MEARRAEQEAKRAKLEEMRRRREERLKNAATGTAAPSSSSPTPQLTTTVRVLSTRPGVVKYAKATQTEPHECAKAKAQDDKDEIRELDAQTSQLSLQEPETQHQTQRATDPETDPVSEPQAPAEPAEPTFTLATSCNEPLVAEILTRALRILERSTNQPNVLIDYAAATTAPATSQVQSITSFKGPYSVCALDFSPHHPNLFVCAHSQANSVASVGASCALVWSLDFPSSPEYTLRASTEIMHVLFSRSHPWLVYGAGYNGQLLAWDLRSAGAEVGSSSPGKAPRTLSPSMKSPVNAGVHLLPICGLVELPSVNHDVLFACGFDGVASVWPSDRLLKPDSRFSLGKSVSALASSPADPNLFLAGTLPGPIFSGLRSDTVASKAGLEGQVYTGHTALVTAIKHHPNLALFLSCGLDWSVKLWRVDHPAPILDLHRVDVVTDVAWHPSVECVFVCASQTRLEVWNLAKSREEPAAEYDTGDLVSKLRWDPRAKSTGGASRLLCGTMDGTCHEFAIAAELLAGQFDFNLL